MNIYDISFSVNANILPFQPYTPNENTEIKMDNFLHEFKNNPNALLNINGNDGWHAGQAFYNTLTYHRILDDKDKKFCFAGAIISFIKTLELGTMQSVMAIDLLINMIDKNKNIVDVYFFAMPNERMVCDFNMPPELLLPWKTSINEAVDKRALNVLRFLIALKENRLDSADTQTRAGQYYLNALFHEAYDRIKNFSVLGIIC